NGDVQSANAPVSVWHWIVVAPVTVNETLGVRLLVGELTAVTVTTGAVASTVNVVKPVPTLPATSMPCTVTVWLPSVGVAVVNGEVQSANGPASVWHWIVVAPVTVKLTEGVRLLVGELTAVTVTTGAVASTVNVVKPVPTLPATSVPWTVTVWLPSAR